MVRPVAAAANNKWSDDREKQEFAAHLQPLPPGASNRAHEIG